MQLTEHHNERQFFLRRADATSAVVVDRPIAKSFVISAESIVEDFPYTASDALDDAAVETILRLKPEVVLLGTGDRIVFPSQKILASFLKRGIGLETMDSAAAARTFNVLIEEGRKAVGVFLLNG
ncbi:MAG TPA: MTH938/NDUFAF3 family protein [Rudaea sp.]|nr:MTH938/NDUFAF3 family protein [Rudaea sp.]